MFHSMHHHGGRRFAGRAPFGHDRGFGGGGPGGGRSRRMVDGGELRLLLLRLIADAPRHGYDLIREIETLTDGHYAPSPGMVYPTLTLLEEMALIEAVQAEGNKKRFAATEEGHAHLAEHREAIEALLARLRDVGRRQSGGAPIRRAMANLRTAVIDRVRGGGVTDDTLHAVAALLDETAQKVERLR